LAMIDMTRSAPPGPSEEVISVIRIASVFLLRSRALAAAS